MNTKNTYSEKNSAMNFADANNSNCLLNAKRHLARFLTPNPNSVGKQKTLIIGAFATVCVAVASVLLFYGCKKNEPTNLIEQQKYGMLASSTVNPTGTTEEDIEYLIAHVTTLAENHNRYLNEIFKNFDFNATDYYNELKNNFHVANMDNIPLSEKTRIWEKFQSNNYEVPTMETLINAITQSTACNNKDRMIELITMIKESDFEGGMFVINSHINNIQNLANAELTSRDLLIVLSYTEGLRKSAEYWLPIELGGNGFGFEVIGSKVCSMQSEREAIKILGKVATADAMSLSVGFTVAGYIGAFFPPATVGALVGVAVEGGVASAIKAIQLGLDKP